jgi:hypothetical protein
MTSLIQRMKDAKSKLKTNSNAEPTTKPKSGKNRFRFLPHWSDVNGDFAQGYGSHFIRNSAGEIKSVYVCDAATHERDCPVCDSLNQAMIHAQDDETKELIKGARASQRFLFNAIDMEGDTKTPFILELSRTTYLSLIEIILLEEDEQNPDFNILTDLKDGHDVYIVKSGVGLKTEYAVSIVTKSTSIDKSIMSKAYNLLEYTNQNQNGSISKSISLIDSLVVPSSHNRLASVGQVDNDVFEAEYKDVPFDDFIVTEIEESSAEDLDEMLADLG